jgi:hypothetical protein
MAGALNDVFMLHITVIKRMCHKIDLFCTDCERLYIVPSFEKMLYKAVLDLRN